MNTTKFIDFFIKYRTTTASGLLLIILYVSKPNATSISIGFIFIVFGMLFRAWSAGYINKNNELATEGPYSLTRNPLYFGNFLLGLGVAIAGRSLICFLIFFLYYLLFFPLLMFLEHQKLTAKFQEKYTLWYKNSNSFFPKIKKVTKTDFNISLYIKNKEYRVAFFSLLVVIVLIFKTIKYYKNY